MFAENKGYMDIDFFYYIIIYVRILYILIIRSAGGCVCVSVVNVA